jgi:hypothetical protein
MINEFDAGVAKAYQDGSAPSVASFFQIDDVVDPTQSRIGSWLAFDPRRSVRDAKATLRRKSA